MPGLKYVKKTAHNKLEIGNSAESDVIESGKSSCNEYLAMINDAYLSVKRLTEWRSSSIERVTQFYVRSDKQRVEVFCD